MAASFLPRHDNHNSTTLFISTEFSPSLIPFLLFSSLLQKPSNACFPLSPDLNHASVAAQASLRQPNPLHELHLVHSPCCKLKGKESIPSQCLPTPSNPYPSPCLPSTDPSAHTYGQSSSEPLLQSKATLLKTSASKPAKFHCQLSK